MFLVVAFHGDMTQNVNCSLCYVTIHPDELYFPLTSNVEEKQTGSFPTLISDTAVLFVSPRHVFCLLFSGLSS